MKMSMRWSAHCEAIALDQARDWPRRADALTSALPPVDQILRHLAPIFLP